MKTIIARNAAIATLLAAALLTGCASVELSTDETGFSQGFGPKDSILERMAADSQGG